MSKNRKTLLSQQFPLFIALEYVGEKQFLVCIVWWKHLKSQQIKLFVCFNNYYRFTGHYFAKVIFSRTNTLQIIGATEIKTVCVFWNTIMTTIKTNITHMLGQTKTIRFDHTYVYILFACIHVHEDIKFKGKGSHIFISVQKK